MPAVPEMVGDELLPELLLTGLTTATPVGATVSSENELVVEVVEFPAASACVAVTVYEPSASAAAGIDQVAPERVADNDWIVVAPCLMTTLTVAASPEATPAVPVMVGVALLMAAPLAGDVTATPVGAAVSTVNVLTALVVELAEPSDWVAVTV